MSADAPREAMRLLLELAGRLHFADRPSEGLPVNAQVELFGRIARAKATAGLSTRKFRTLDGPPLTEFCSRHDLTRAEIRFAQGMVDYIWQCWRTGKFCAQVVRERRKRSLQ
jgi:hypothetical protein